ncbi:pleiotropic drug resistance ABC transporter [Amanita rubescens]|nr:pleiotropic drug resistance ABC transporter [Amanita rubescens]
MAPSRPERIAASHKSRTLTPDSIRTTPREWSSVSRVDLNHFDGEGVDDLKRSLSHDDSNADARSEVSDRTIIVDDNFDFGKTLLRMVKKANEAHIKPRELGVMFRDLRVVGLASAASHIPTVGAFLNPSALLENVQNLRHPYLKTILSGFEGVVRPGEMLLVLGRPEAGSTTFLKALANRRELYKHYRGDVQYCPEEDVHFPTLTVDQTLNFASTTRTPREHLTKSRSQFARKETDMLTTLFGLGHAKNTRIGNAAIRGVSGGEKKRVSIAEVLATRALISCWDNSTRGLDSSTALEFIHALRLATDTMHLTTVAAIYQASESIYKHFDKVCVIYEGKMAYFGPADKARQYFIDMGYEPANRQSTSDFLVAVTDPNGRITRKGARYIPKTATEFAKYFRKSSFAAANRSDMASYEVMHVGNEKRALEYKESARAELARFASKGSPYLLTVLQQAMAVMFRRARIVKGDTLTYIQIFVFIFKALIAGSLFFQVPEATSAYFSRGGVLFYALLFTTLTAMAEIPALYTQRPIVLRHYRAAMYHPFVEALALTLVDIPITAISLSIFSVVLYFMAGLQRSAEQFFIFLLFVFVTSLTMKAWFRSIAAAFTSEPVANSVAGLSVLALAIYTGYAIPKPLMIGALRWISYINPIRYSFEAILTNEFRTLQGTCSALVPQGPGYENVTLANQVCTAVGAIPGQPFVDGSNFLLLSYDFKFSHTWMNLGIVLAFFIGFFLALLAFTELNTSTSYERLIVLFKRGSERVLSSNIACPDVEGPKDFFRFEEFEPSPKCTLPSSPSSTDVESRADICENLDSPPSSAGTPTLMSPTSTEVGSYLCTKKLESQLSGGWGATTPLADIFSWQHVDYTVQVGAESRKLLDDVSGYVAPGKLTALMGESGAGKTTLLNVLAQRVSTGVVRGDFLVNGQRLPIDFQAQTGYCQQMDTHVPSATVREALLFSANLRQPASVPSAEKEAYVEECLKKCGLEEHADASVGSLGVEQRKRTTIAVELAAKPKLLLFLDEPTSGLDSQSAWSIVSFLRSLADNGQAILCTIHQPSAELFQVFDRILLLRKGGQTAYFGDLGYNATTLIDYFEENGARKCLPEENPAEYMLDVIGAGATATSELDWYSIWCNSKEFVDVQAEINSIHLDGRNRPALEATIRSEFATIWLYQVKDLFIRNARGYWRNPAYIFSKLVLNIVGGLFIGFTFFKAKDTQQGTQDKLFSIFMATILSVPLANQLQSVFIRMRDVYEIRECQSRMYSWTALLTSQLFIEIPWNIFGTALLFVSWYWTVGFETSRAGYTYLMIGIFFPLYYTTVAQAIASMAPNTEIAALLFSTLFSFVFVFDGVLQPFRVLTWWKWMYHLSPFTYLVEGLFGQVIGQQEINCADIEFVTLNPPSGLTCAQYMDPYISFAGGYLANPNAMSGCLFCSTRTTDEFLAANFNIFYHNHWRDVYFMIAYVAFNIFCIFAFTWFFRIRTGSVFAALKKRPATRK